MVVVAATLAAVVEEETVKAEVLTVETKVKASMYRFLSGRSFLRKPKMSL
jgi:hypothetical protein